MSEASGAQDLTGVWHGTFFYTRDEAPSTPFLAKIKEANGRLEGSIIEPETFQSSNQTIAAQIAGVRMGTSVDFTKDYLGGHEGYDNPVDYIGQLSPDSNAIIGVWHLLDMNGRFEMFREKAMDESIAIEEAAETTEPHQVTNLLVARP